MANPQLFSEGTETNFMDAENTNEKKLEVDGSPDHKEILATKEPEMFENLESEEDFEIPAFLRRQKN